MHSTTTWHPIYTLIDRKPRNVVLRYRTTRRITNDISKYEARLLTPTDIAEIRHLYIAAKRHLDIPFCLKL